MKMIENDLVDIDVLIDTKAHVVDTQVDGQPVQLALWWTSGKDEYDRFRALSYLNTDVVLISFAVDNPESFDNVESKGAHCLQ